jgi:hypothetical protein
MVRRAARAVTITVFKRQSGFIAGVAGAMATQRGHAVVFSKNMPTAAVGMAPNAPELKWNRSTHRPRDGAIPRRKAF